MSSTKEGRRAFLQGALLLCALQLVLFGPFLARLGFYHDDWANLERCIASGGFWAGVKLYAGLLWGRPLQIFFYPVLLALGGLDPLASHLFFFALEIIQALLLFALFSRLFDARRALLAAALSVAFPNHAATHFWPSASAQTIAIDLALASLILHLDWLKDKRWPRLAAAMSCYLASLLFYEAVAFLPLIPVAVLSLGGKNLKKTAADFLPFALVLAAAVLWQRAGLLLFGKTNGRPLGGSLGHAAYALLVGLQCLSNRVVMLCARTLAGAWDHIGLLKTLGAAALALAAARLPALHNPARKERAALLAAFVAAWLAAYLPYAVSQDYTPSVVGIMSRTSACGGIAGALLVLLLLEALRGFQRPALGLLVFIFTLTNWELADQWCRSWTLQQDIIDKLAAHAPRLPPGAKVIAEIPRYVDDDPVGAIVFDAHYDIGAALRLKTGRPDLAADVVSPRLDLASRSGPNLYYYRYRLDTLELLPRQ